MLRDDPSHVHSAQESMRQILLPMQLYTSHPVSSSSIEATFIQQIHYQGIKSKQTLPLSSPCLPNHFSLEIASTCWCTSSGGTLMLIPFCVKPISCAKVECGFQEAEFLGLVSSNILSTCSSDRPLVSGTRKYAKVRERQQREPQRKKTLAPRFASFLPSPTR